MGALAPPFPPSSLLSLHAPALPVLACLRLLPYREMRDAGASFFLSHVPPLPPHWAVWEKGAMLGGGGPKGMVLLYPHPQWGPSAASSLPVPLVPLPR